MIYLSEFRDLENVRSKYIQHIVYAPILQCLLWLRNMHDRIFLHIGLCCITAIDSKNMDDHVNGRIISNMFMQISLDFVGGKIVGKCLLLICFSETYRQVSNTRGTKS